MIISAATHPHYHVRDDCGDEVKDVLRIDTDAMTIKTLVRDRHGAVIKEGDALCTKVRKLLAYRFEPYDVLRVQIGQPIEGAS